MGSAISSSAQKQVHNAGKPKSSRNNSKKGAKMMADKHVADEFADQPPKEYALTKLRPGCMGMFWRADPRPNGPRLASNNNWPRDGATLRGYKIEHRGKKWLLATHVKQERGEWEKAPKGAAMPFEYNNHYCLREI